MSEVNFPVEVGGDGSTYTDDANPSTGMGNGGFRTRLMPMLTQVINVAKWVRDKALEVSQWATSASNAAGAAAGSASAANTSQSAATQSAQAATSAADLAYRWAADLSRVQDTDYSAKAWAVADVAMLPAGSAKHWAQVAQQAAGASELPPIAGQANRYLRVNADATGVTWSEVSGGSSFDTSQPYSWPALQTFEKTKTKRAFNDLSTGRYWADTIATITTSYTIDLTRGDYHSLGLSGGSVQLVAEPLGAGPYTSADPEYDKYLVFVICLVQSSTAASITWWSGIKWFTEDGLPPPAPAAGEKQEYIMTYHFGKTDPHQWTGRVGQLSKVAV